MKLIENAEPMHLIVPDADIEELLSLSMWERSPNLGQTWYFVAWYDENDRHALWVAYSRE